MQLLSYIMVFLIGMSAYLCVVGAIRSRKNGYSIQARKILAMKSLNWPQSELENPDLG